LPFSFSWCPVYIIETKVVKILGTITRERRQILKAALFASGALLVSSAGIVRAASLSRRKVIVIGAGISGLAAAHALNTQGADVTVLEAKNRTGGRLWTDFSMGAPFEFGAGWIHGASDENPVSNLADSVGAKTVVTDDENLTVFDDRGIEISDQLIEKIDKKWLEILDHLDSELEDSDNRSLVSAISDIAPDALNDPGVIWALSAYTEFSKGGSIEDLSAVLFNADKAFDLTDVVVTSGYDKILEPLLEGVDIRFGTNVMSIDYGDNGARIKTTNQTFSTDFVICSLPLGVLKAQTVKFSPALPAAYQKSIKTLGFGSVTKIALKFDLPFWDIETQYFGIMTEPKGRWNYWVNYRTFSDQNILLGLSVGAYAPVADRMSDAEMTEDALEVLRNVWGDNVGVPVQTLATHWSMDPHTLGAYTYPTPGSKPSDFDGLAAPILDRLVLCGEHTIFDFAGTTHGAYMSGLRAAEHVIELAG
jgi:monoamine oxidase